MEIKLWAVFMVILVTLTAEHRSRKQEEKLWMICIFYKDIVEMV